MSITDIKNKKLFISLFIILIILFLIIFTLTKKNKVDYYVLKPVDINYSILGNCIVDYPDPLDIITANDGEIKTILVKEGSQIKKDQILMNLDDFVDKQNLIISYNNLLSSQLKLKNSSEETLPKLRQQLVQDKINLDLAEKDLERNKEAYKSGGISQSELENITNNYNKLLANYNQTKLSVDSFFSSGLNAELSKQVSINKAQYDLAKKKLEDRTINSPINGTLINLNVQAGQRVNSGFILATVLENKNWAVVSNIDQKELPFLSINQKAFVLLDAYQDKKLNAHVSFIGSKIDQKKGTCEIRLEITDKNSFIKHGMTGSIEIFAEKFTKVLGVPSRFIKKTDDGYYVLISDKKNKLTKVNIRQIGERWKIIEGIKEGTIILDPNVKSGISNIIPGREVKE